MNNILCSLPLSVHEYDEWGDPNDPEVAKYIKSYSPYDNIESGIAYPPVFITAALKDTRVRHGDAAKWVAMMRSTATV